MVVAKAIVLSKHDSSVHAEAPFVENMSAGHAATHNTSLQRSFSIVNVSYR